MTQADVADKLNIHRTAYTKYETDRANPDKTCLVMLAELFSVTVDQLLGKEQTVAELHDPTTSEVAISLSPREQELLAVFRRLSTQQQDELLRNGREYDNKQ